MNNLIDREKAIETLKEYEVVESDNFTRTDPVSMMTVATIRRARDNYYRRIIISIRMCNNTISTLLV